MTVLQLPCVTPLGIDVQAVNGIVESVVAAKLRITPPTVHLDSTYVAAVLSVLAGCICE